jgi:drug/metabolite transporter (DMT)-like permease
VQESSKPTDSTDAAVSARARPAAAQQNVLRGIGLMVVAIGLFSCLDATAKYMASVLKLPVAQVTWVRFISQVAMMVLVLGAVSLPRLFSSRKVKHQIARSLLMLLSTVLNFLALRHLRLDQTQTIYFLAPLMVALLAGPFLGEWVGWRRMVAIIVGFFGILVVVRPGIVALEPAMLFALGSMLCYATFSLLTRYLTRFDPAEVTLFYSMIAGTVFMAPFAVMDWVWPKDVLTWVLLASMGMWGGIGHYIFIIAYRHAPASTLAPFLYFGLITHGIMGYLVFDQLPDCWTIIGAGIVIASGLYLLHRERVVALQRWHEESRASRRPGA